MPGLPPRNAARTLNPEVVTRGIRARWPELECRSVRLLGAGWDHDAYLVDRRWVFRFPKRGDAADALIREAVVTATVEPSLQHLGVRVPVPRWHGMPGTGFPYPFHGAPFLPGCPADGGGPYATDLPDQLAAVLGAVHRMNLAAADGRDLPRAPHPDERWLTSRITRISATLTRDDEPLRRSLAWVNRQRRVPPAAPAGNDRLLHGDICPDHLLVAPATGRLVGVIDGGDTSRGDPVRGFLTLPLWLGWPAARRVREVYPGPLDPDFDARWRYFSRLYSLLWLADATEHGTDVAKHRRWVANASTIPSFRTCTATATRSKRLPGKAARAASNATFTARPCA